MPAALLLVLALCLPSPLPASGLSAENELACASLLSGGTGRIEELRYLIKWGVVTAGSAVMRLTPLDAPSGPEGYLIEFTARSNEFIDVFYKVRDRGSSVVERDFRRSVFYGKEQREGSFKRDEFLEYDLEDGVGMLFRDGKLKNSIRLPDEYQDPLSGSYSFRAEGGKPGDTITRYATDGRRLILAKGTVLGSERVSTPAGDFDCLMVELFPETLEGPFKHKGKGRMLIWFSDDSCRLPVKMATEVLIGSVETVLEKILYLPAPGGAE